MFSAVDRSLISLVTVPEFSAKEECFKSPVGTVALQVAFLMTKPRLGLHRWLQVLSTIGGAVHELLLGRDAYSTYELDGLRLGLSLDEARLRLGGRLNTERSSSQRLFWDSGSCLVHPEFGVSYVEGLCLSIVRADGVENFVFGPGVHWSSLFLRLKRFPIISPSRTEQMTSVCWLFETNCFIEVNFKAPSIEYVNTTISPFPSTWPTSRLVQSSSALDAAQGTSQVQF